MLTKIQLRHSFSVYTDEVDRCKKHGCYWSLVHMILSLPDILNTLEVDAKEPKTGDRYEAWCDKYLSSHDPSITKKEWWDVRNNILHQGFTLTKKTTRYKGFKFYPPGRIKHRDVDPMTNKMMLDVCILADEMLAAMDRWIDDLIAHPARQKQVEKYIPELPWEDPTGPSPQAIRTSVASSPMAGFLSPGYTVWGITGTGPRNSTGSQNP